MLYVEILKRPHGKLIGTIPLVSNCMWAFCLRHENCQNVALPRHIARRNFPQIIAQNEVRLPCQSDELTLCIPTQFIGTAVILSQ